MYRLKIDTLIFACFCICSRSFCQGLPIDSLGIKHWQTIANASISNNGKYFIYTVNNKPAGSSTLIIESTNMKWKREFAGCNFGYFTGNSQYALLNFGDKLGILKLGRAELIEIRDIQSIKIPESGDKRWIAYQKSGRLYVYDLLSERELCFTHISDYLFNSEGTVVLLNTEHVNKKRRLLWVNLFDGKIDTIWSSGVLDSSVNVMHYTFDKTGTKLSFVTNVRNDSGIANCIWYFKIGMINAIRLVNNGQTIGDSGLAVSDRCEFSQNGSWIYFDFEAKDTIPGISSNAVMVDVWNFKDIYLQSEQTNNPIFKQRRKYAAAINTTGGEIVRITYGHESIVRKAMSDYFIISDNRQAATHYWDNSESSYYLFSLKEGSKTLISRGRELFFWFSPSGKYIVYYSGRNNNYYSYDILKNESICISESPSQTWATEYFYPTKNKNIPVGIGGWLEKDSVLFVYDNCDIWQLDLSGSRAPRNVTNSYGRSKQIKFRLVYGGDDFEVSNKNNYLLLTAFNTFTKDNGFYRLKLGSQKDPELLTMGPFIYYIDQTPGSQIPTFSHIHKNFGGLQPIKAADSNVWVVTRMTASNSPNYYLTTDFRTFKALSRVQPESNYNWPTSELLAWKQEDGVSLQGILYKPKNFDPTRKYPVIFNYYEELSFEVNAFIRPAFSEDNINTPWFVSREYLVFMPDFRLNWANETGFTNGENAYKSIKSAVKLLSKLPFIDVNRMALQGHSFGGGITNYLITRTTCFAAAVEAAGASDIITSALSLAGSIGKPVQSRLHGPETGQGRIGANLWQRSDLYLKNNPILNADNVETPLLIMHNMADFAVPWMQGVEMFLALQRLDKRVWMLQYDNGLHSVWGKDSEDYTARLTAYFNHYLKDAPAPMWMTQGVPARLKGIETGYSLDPSGNCGKDCKVCTSWNEKWRSDSVAVKEEMKKWEKF